MRGQCWLVVILSAVMLGCGKSEATKPAESKTTETKESAPAATTPATPANDALTVPPAQPAAKEEPKADVILPPSDPTPEPPKNGSVDLTGPSVLSAVAAKDNANWGTLKGRFVFDGPPPKPVKIEVTKDQECCGKYPDELVDESVAVGDKGGLKWVFVYLRTKDAKVHPEAASGVASEIKINNRHCRFNPHGSVLWAGKQTIVFGNEDPINHAVKIDPLNAKNQAINNQLPSGVDVKYSFSAEERIPVSITCGIHPWQKGWVLPMENPYAAVTGDDGSFVIANLPVGKLEFQVWQEKSGYLAAKSDWKRGRFEMEIKPGDNDLGDIKVSPKLFEK
ncbi:hypothetical protein K2X85_20210 [bacterium]|nr:hypothetical protein [bacterium]